MVQWQLKRHCKTVGGAREGQLEKTTTGAIMIIGSNQSIEAAELAIFRGMFDFTLID